MNKAELEIQEALNDPSVHNFAKDILRASQNLDIVDCLNDLEYCQHLLRNRINAALEALGCPRK